MSIETLVILQIVMSITIGVLGSNLIKDFIDCVTTVRKYTREQNRKDEEEWHG